MRSDAEGVVEGLYAAWRLQDVDTTLAYCADEMRYTVHQPEGISGIGGVVSGKPALRSYLEAICATWEFAVLTPVILYVDSTVVREQTRFSSVHRRSGLPLAGTKRHIWHIENGRVVNCDEYQDAVRIRAFLRMAEAQ